MIIARSPLRITLGGGGTDLPSYYRQHGGFLIAAAIDKYVFVTVTRPFTPGIYLKYSELERVGCVDEIRHPFIREAIRLVNAGERQIEITTLADIPSGTGLGSSGSFGTALLKALYAYRREMVNAPDLARLACEVEIARLGEPVGKQDQHIAAYGGLTCFAFDPDESVRAIPLRISLSTLHEIEDNLLLFFTGFSRGAGDVLKDQQQRTQNGDQDMIANLNYVKDLAIQSKRALECGKPVLLGELMHEHWEHKKRRSPGMTNGQIDEWYELARQNGAVGGKLVGAGGGGFLMFYAEDQRRLRSTMATVGLQEVRFRFDFEGTRMVMS